MVKDIKSEKKKEIYDVADVVVIDDKKKSDEFDSNKDYSDLGNDDDELDLDDGFEFDDGGD